MGRFVVEFVIGSSSDKHSDDGSLPLGVDAEISSGICRPSTTLNIGEITVVSYPSALAAASVSAFSSQQREPASAT